MPTLLMLTLLVVAVPAQEKVDEQRTLPRAPPYPGKEGQR